MSSVYHHLILKTTMLSKRDIRAIMLYEFKHGTNAAQTTPKINEKFGETLVTASTIQKWFKIFREGSENLENEECESPESVLYNISLREAVEANPRTTILYDNRKRSGQWLDMDEAPKPKLSPKKIMVTVWCSDIEIIYYDFMKPGETIELKSYCQQIKKMQQKLSQKVPALVNRKELILLHDNSKPHVSKKTVFKLRELGYETLPHPSYSPDFPLTDFYFFKRLNNFLTDKIFRNDEQAKTAFKAFIESRDPDFYVDRINKLVSCWQYCIDCNGSYFK
uniref:Histone-lysine N-methyltransferase SETMAR (inferred by orthology to a human protein) n=1 Tax=Strongyloides venezuelensis TaxID=75913 RepID=A0A0K0G1C6_STRVS